MRYRWMHDYECSRSCETLLSNGLSPNFLYWNKTCLIIILQENETVYVTRHKFCLRCCYFAAYAEYLTFSKPDSFTWWIRTEFAAFAPFMCRQSNGNCSWRSSKIEWPPVQLEIVEPHLWFQKPCILFTLSVGLPRYCISIRHLFCHKKPKTDGHKTQLTVHCIQYPF